MTLPSGDSSADLFAVTASSYMILSASNSTNNLSDKTLTFPTFRPDVGLCSSSCCFARPPAPPLSQGDVDGCCCQSRAIQETLRDL